MSGETVIDELLQDTTLFSNNKPKWAGGSGSQGLPSIPPGRSYNSIVQGEIAFGLKIIKNTGKIPVFFCILPINS